MIRKSTGDDLQTQQIAKLGGQESRTTTEAILPTVKEATLQIIREGTEGRENRELTDLYTHHLARIFAREIDTVERARGRQLTGTEREELLRETEKNFSEMALDLAEIEKLKEFLETDRLTELRNKSGMKKAYDTVRKKEKERVFQGKTVIVRMDLDRFKLINDLYGHDKGDEVLKAVAKSLQILDLFRPLDVCARYGGDEYGIILTDVKPSHGLTLEETIEKILKRIVKKIEEINKNIIEKILEEESSIGGDDDPPDKAKSIKTKNSPHLTASVGYNIVDEFGTDEDSSFDAIDKKADTSANEAKLYQAILPGGGERIINFRRMREIRVLRARELGVPLQKLEKRLKIAGWEREITRPTNNTLISLEASPEKIERVKTKLAELRAMLEEED